MKWIKGRVENIDGSSLGEHNWMEYNGKIYDPTKSQFSEKFKYIKKTRHKT